MPDQTTPSTTTLTDVGGGTGTGTPGVTDVGGGDHVRGGEHGQSVADSHKSPEAFEHKSEPSVGSGSFDHKSLESLEHKVD